MVSIIEVTTKRQLRQFVEYPNILYKDVPQFVPATFDDDMSDWDKKKNPAFEYCEARCWMAMRSGEMVGRIGAILSHKANEKCRPLRWMDAYNHLPVRGAVAITLDRVLGDCC